MIDMIAITIAPGNNIKPESTGVRCNTFCTNIGNTVSDPIIEIIVTAIIAIPTVN